MAAQLSSKQIKFIKSLSQKKFRDEYNLFVAEGEKVVEEALNSNFKIKEIYKESEIGAECMGRITNLNTPSPILAIVEKPNYIKEEIIDQLYQKIADNPNLLYLGLDTVKDPGNLGTIIRIADWFGIDAIFAEPGTVEVYNPKVVQATMGAIFRKKVIYHNLLEIIQIFSENKLPVYGTFLDGENIYSKELDKRGLIIMGSESFGISDKIKELVSNKLLIPSYPADVTTSESLNVAVATAIICAEFRR